MVVGNHIEIQRKPENELGKGAFGVVWRGVDKRKKNDAVAVKKVEKTAVTEISLSRELTYMQQCRHQNVIELYDHIEYDKHIYFVLELCEENLDEFVKDKDIDLPTCLEYMIDICSGIEYLHDKGIAHRDIKPANVLVKDNVLKVSDLGLARELTTSSSVQTATGGVGTPSWMAPEVCAMATDNSLKYNQAVDIFSLALLFLSLLTHRPGDNLKAHTGMHIVCDNILVKLWKGGQKTFINTGC